MVIDGGGRGAVLVEKYSESKHVGKILSIPGNMLMQELTHKKVVTYLDIKTTDKKEILKICLAEKVDLVDVAQDDAVEAGVVDLLLENGIDVVGPTKNAGQIEWDKAWSREFMLKYNIAIPKFKVCKSEKEGLDYIKNQKEGKWFIKANGLVEGKGALPAENKEEAKTRIREMSRFGEKGKTFLIEQWLEGEEFSTFVLCDGYSFKIVGTAQDYKRLLNGDKGVNTGGMGCSFPVTLLSKSHERQVEKIIKNTVKGMLKEGRPFKGVLYFGGILVKNKVYTIEFNARWGDPEAEIIVPSIKNDFYLLGKAIAHGKLKDIKISQDKTSRVIVAITSNSDKEVRLFGLDNIRKKNDIRIYNSRVKKQGNLYFCSKGRQFYIVGKGKNIAEAREKVYQAASHLFLENNELYYRTDIGWREVERYYK